MSDTHPDPMTDAAGGAVRTSARGELARRLAAAVRAVLALLARTLGGAVRGATVRGPHASAAATWQDSRTATPPAAYGARCHGAELAAAARGAVCGAVPRYAGGAARVTATARDDRPR